MDSATQVRALEVLDSAVSLAAEYGVRPTLGEVKGWLWVIGLTLVYRGPMPEQPPQNPTDDEDDNDEEDTETE